MKVSVLGWSVFSGVVLGILVGAVLITVAYVIGMMLPERLSGFVTRARLPLLLFAFLALPLIGGVLGYLEGRLKLS